MNGILQKHQRVQIILRLVWGGEAKLEQSEVECFGQCISGSPYWYNGVKAAVLLFIFARWKWVTGQKGRCGIFGETARPLFEYVRKNGSHRNWAEEFAGVHPLTRQDVLRSMVYHEGSPPRGGEFWTGQAVYLEDQFLHPKNIVVMVDDRLISNDPPALFLQVTAIRCMLEYRDRRSTSRHDTIRRCRNEWQELMWKFDVPETVLNHSCPLFAP